MNDAQHPLNALPQGYRLQEYELVRVRGQGGFGMTYLGFDHNLDKAVAIKEYLPADIATRTGDNSVAPQASQFRGDFEWGLGRFLDEARTLARFDHRHIVKVHRFFEAHGTAYIVMEYAEGETLSAFLARKGTLSEAELKTILYPVLDGLEVVHRADFLHRDIKPDNIIIRDEDNSPVLLDFGAARQAIGAKSRPITSIITPGYAPIEQYSTQGDQGPWTDIYALGAVCYQALTGQVPDDATKRIRRDSLVPVAERCAGQADAGFLAAIDRAVKVEEEDRPQSVAAWRAALFGAPPVVKPAKGRPADSRQRAKVDDPRVRQPKKRKGPVFAAVACVLALLIGGGYYYYEYIHLPDQRRQAQEGEVAKKVSTLLSGAAEDLARDRLTSPSGNNAWEKYQAVLEIAPGHKEASAGLDSVIGRYVTKFDGSLRDKAFDKADEYMSRIRGVWVDAAVLSSLEERLSAARGAEQRRQVKQRARLAAEEAERLRQSKLAEYKGKFEESLGRKDFDKAGRYVDSLRAVNASAPVLSELGGRLSAAREAEQRRQEVERRRLEAERARLAAEEAERRQAKTAEYEGKFEAALGREDFGMADVYLDSIRAVDADAPVLSGLEGRLSATRRRDAGRTFKDCAQCPKVVVVPSGSFTMGSPGGESGRDDDEGPRHRVRIDYRLAVGVYEVTFAEWDACVSAGGCGGHRPNDRGWGRGNRPVINVSWKDAQSYVRWLSNKTGKSYRLLSESEWEYVSRAGSVTAYSWGNEIGHNRANCGGCGSRWDNKKTAPVGSFRANAWGLHDVHGNVWEWVEDCWNASYRGAPADGSAWESGNCSERVLRGGSGFNAPWILRAADRSRYSTGYRYFINGFRIARTLTP